jgi:dienelactone hydrolase
MKRLTITLLIVIALISIAVTPKAYSEIVTENVSYRHGEKPLQGFLAYDDSIEGKTPGVLIVHEWWGLNDYVRERAKGIAGLGYVAFALDMYGKDKVTQHPEQAKEWAEEVRSSMELWRQRALAGLKVLQENPKVDTSRIAAIGYCFGGSTVQLLAYSGADLEGVVSFHGSLMPPPENMEKTAEAETKILILHGAADPMATQQDMMKYISGMESSGMDWQMVLFGGAKHSFTNPAADKAGMPAIAYDKDADQRSWEYMKIFFDELFGSAQNDS